MNSAEVLIKFKGDTKDSNNAIKEQEKNLDDLKKKGELAFAGLTTAVDAFTTAILKNGIEYNAQIETYLTRLETLTGSAEEANKVLEQIKKDALATPFEVSSLTQAESLLLATGLSAEEARADILALGDAISASGGGNVELSRMAVNLQQIKNVGKASALDIKQFAYAGIDIFGLLADSMGVTRAEASELDVTYEMLSKALQKASNKGGKYYNAMVKQSKTYNGAMSNLKESVQVFAGAMSEGLFNALKKIIIPLTDFFDWMTKNKDVIIAIAKPALAFINIIAGFVAVNKATTLLKGLFAVMQAHPFGLMVSGAVGVISILKSLASGESEFSKEHKATMEELKKESEAIDSQVQSWKDLQEAQKNAINVGMTEITHTESLYDELKKITNENGKVKKGYEERAKFITGELSDSLGVEIKMTNGVIQNYQGIQKEIEKAIEIKKAQIILNASEELYTEAIKNELNAQSELTKMDKKVEKAKKKLSQAEKEYAKNNTVYTLLQMQARQKELEKAEDNYNKQDDLVKSYYYNIGQYQQNYEYFKAGEYDKISQIDWNYVKDLQKTGDAEKKQLEQQIIDNENMVNKLKQLKEQSGSDIYDQQIKDGEKQIENLRGQLKQYTSVTDEGLNNATRVWNNSLTGRTNSAYEEGKNFILGLKNGMGDSSVLGSLWNTAVNIADKLKQNFRTALGIHSPSTITADMGMNLLKGFSVGIDEQENKLFKKVNNFSRGLLDNIDINAIYPNQNVNINPSTMATMQSSNITPIVNVYNSMEMNPLGQVVSNVKTFSGGAKNDYNYGVGV